jgi:oligopeptide/dipeptide ABC transporter ATP-binding protein
MTDAVSSTPEGAITSYPLAPGDPTLPSIGDLAGRSRPEGDAVLAVRDLRVAFRSGGSTTEVVRGVDFQLERGRTLVVVGESGSGKSVTARSTIGLLPSSATATGSIQFDGQELIGLPEKGWRQLRGSQFGIVFQDPTRALNPTMRVGNQVAEGIRRHFQLSRADAMSRALEVLSLVGIPEPRLRAREYPHQLSGGMRQRIMMAIAISCDPKVLIADEPTTALDVTIQEQIMELLRDLQREFDLAMLLITHDMGLAFSYGDEIAVMYAGRIVERALAKELRHGVRMPYTKGLLDSVPHINDVPHSAFRALSGRPPDPATLPSGCAFSPRCFRSAERCEVEQPPLGGSPEHSYECWYPL